MEAFVSPQWITWKNIRSSMCTRYKIQGDSNSKVSSFHRILTVPISCRNWRVQGSWPLSLCPFVLFYPPPNLFQRVAVHRQESHCKRNQCATSVNERTLLIPFENELSVWRILDTCRNISWNFLYLYFGKSFLSIVFLCWKLLNIFLMK